MHCPDLGGGNTGAGVDGNNTTQMFTIAGSGAATAAVAEETPALSQDGRFVVFSTVQNDITQVVLRDTCVGAETDNRCSPSTKIVSATIDGAWVMRTATIR